MTVGSTITYTTLIADKNTAGSIANWLNHSSVQASAAQIVAEAESAIYRRLRHWRMLKKTTGTMTANSSGTASPVDYITLPDDYLEDKILYITGVNFQKLKRKTMEEVTASYGYDGNGYRIVQQPLIYYNDADGLNFDSPPDQAYPYLLRYYAQPESLATVSGGTNFLTIFYPRLLRVACCAAASEFMKDAGQGNYDRTYWLEQTNNELLVAQVESDRSVRSQDIGMILT